MLNRRTPFVASEAPKTSDNDGDSPPALVAKPKGKYINDSQGWIDFRQSLRVEYFKFSSSKF